MSFRRSASIVIYSLLVLALTTGPSLAGPIRELGEQDPNSPLTYKAPSVKLCEGTSDCTQVFALRPSTPPSVYSTVRVANFWPSSPVHVWWVHNVPDSELTYDCSQDVPTSQTHLGDLTTGSNGVGSLAITTLPPSGSYWVCATTAAHTGGGPENKAAEHVVVVSPA